MKPLIAMFGAVAVTLAAGQAMAQMSPADKTFVTKAASGGLAEVALGQVASQKASDPKVRQFGQQMVTDHTQANQELQQIAKQQQMAIPAKPESAETAKQQRLEAMKGSSFDAAYMKDMVQDHQQDVADFRQEAETGQNPALKGFAQKYLPVLEHHLQMAQTTAAEK
jgi:putative membrane protein